MQQENKIVVNLVLDEAFRKWVLNGQTNDPEFWKSWTGNSWKKTGAIRKAGQFVLKMHEANEHLTDGELQEELTRLTQSHTMGSSIPHGKPFRRLIWKYAAAAIIVVGMIGGIYTASQMNFGLTGLYEGRKNKLGNERVEVVNDENVVKLVTLSDGSQVQLYPKSRLSYPKAFRNNRREVFLSGEGFFEVTPNTEKPFLVYANELMTRVVGTSFTVRAFADATKIEVAVRTGEVAVSTLKQNESAAVSKQMPDLMLTPNQQAVFDRTKHALEKSLIDTPIPLEGGADTRQIFNNTPVSQAFDTFSKAYGIPIIYDRTALQHCEISAEFNGETFYRQLDLMCKAINARYTITNGEVLVKARGCTPY